MAEIAAGAVVAEQVASTAAYAGAAGYALAKPTNELKVSFTQIAATSPDATSTSFARSNHTFTVMGSKAYLFGGQTSEGKLASNSIHSFSLAKNSDSDYHLAPAIPLGDGGRVPEPRMNHSACAFNSCVAIYGGCDASGYLIDDPSIWLYETEKSVWHAMPTNTAEGPNMRSGAKLFSHGNRFILYGGKGEGGSHLSEVWHFDTVTKMWSQLPSAPVSTSNAAMGGSTLYLIAGNDNLSSNFHYLNTEPGTDHEARQWETITFPTNPLTPGPKSREKGGLLYINTGYGRQYLLYFFGERTSEVTSAEETQGPTHWTDIWSFQLPSSDLSVKAAKTLSEAIQPAKIKDAIRSKVGIDGSGTHTWSEVEVKPPGDILAHEGKVHPGPRSAFGCDVLGDGRSVVLWGGHNAKGECEGDGWIMQIE